MLGELLCRRRRGQLLQGARRPWDLASEIARGSLVGGLAVGPAEEIARCIGAYERPSSTLR